MAAGFGATFSRSACESVPDEERVIPSAPDAAENGGRSPLAVIPNPISKFAVPLRQVPQRCFQLTKPWFEILPLFQRTPVNRLAHLLRRGRQHRAIGFPETPAAPPQ